MAAVTWVRALTTIPRVGEEEWRRLGLLSRWLIAARAAVLVMTFNSVAIAGLVAARDGAFSPLHFGLCLVGLLLAHATNNLVNDITDSATGVDAGNYFRKRYGTQPLEQGLMTRREAVLWAALTGAAAVAAGAALAYLRGPGVLWLMGAGAVFVLFYTWPLKHVGLGEPSVVLVWGPLMTGGSYWVITGSVSHAATLAGLPFALAATVVLFGKHIDKLAADREKKVRTLPVLLGERAARWVAIVLVALIYAGVVGLVASRSLGPALLLSLGGLHPAWLLVRAYSRPAPAAPPESFPPNVWPLWFSAFAFHHTRRFGLFYLAGLALDVALHRLG